jgi:hypothetical protein
LGEGAQGLHVFPLISWIGAIVLVFAAIVPSTPGKTLVAALIAVSMNPIGMVTAKARGVWDYGPWENVVVMHYPTTSCRVAVVISYVMTRLSLQVARARRWELQVGRPHRIRRMGEVYRATHRMLARPAAIKLLRPGLLAKGNEAAAQLAVKRFWREAEAAASLRSQHTFELYDFGVLEDQTVYFVMELLDEWTSRPWCGRPGHCRPDELFICSPKSASRWRRRTREAWSIATSSPRTSTSDEWDSATTT